MTSSRLSSRSGAMRSRDVSSDRFRWVTWWSSGWLVVMLVATIFASRTIDKAIRDSSGRSLRMILDGNVAELRLYLSELQTASEQLASQRFANAVLKSGDTPVAATGGVGPGALHMERESANLPSVIDAWVITDADGKIQSSSSEQWIGKQCNWSDSNERDLHRRSSTLVLPNKIAKSEDLMVFSLSPVFNDYDLQGTIGWCLDPRDSLSDRLTDTKTGTVFLFDRSARMLTRDRLDRSSPQEVSGDKADDRDWQPTSLRTPHWASANGRASQPNDVSEQPLTAMAAKATRGSSGFDTDGYPNHLGVDVISAWQWMPEYRLGMAIEADMSETLFPVRVLNYLITGLLASVMASGFAIAAVVARSRRSENQNRDDQSEVRRLGQYELIELLGVGGMGSVYRGRHEFLRRDVAIKVLEGEQLSKQAVTRFRREVQSTSKLRHPNTIAIYDYGQAESLSPLNIRETGNALSKTKTKRNQNEGNSNSSDATQEDSAGVFYYVMEYVDGITLQQLIDYYGPQSPERTVHLLLQICGSIAEAHQSGLIHRDIKPGNILLCAESNSYDHIKVLDFGLVKDINATDTVAVTMTRSDSFTGTPLYMAPETIRDATQASPSGDLYSIGAVGYALLTGKPTYEGESAIDLCLKQLEESPVSPEIRLGRSLPKSLQDCIMSCLSLDSTGRPSSIAELVKQLDSLPESTGWNQVDSVDWWENVFEANRDQTPIETKSDTVADQPLEGVS